MIYSSPVCLAPESQLCLTLIFVRNSDQASVPGFSLGIVQAIIRTLFRYKYKINSIIVIKNL